MKLTAQNLLPAVTAVKNVIENRQTMPALSHIKLDAADDKLILTGSDLESEIRYTLAEVEITEPGSVCVHAQKLYEFCNNTGDQAVTIETVSDTQCRLKARSRATVNTLPADEYPIMPEDENESATFSLDAAELTDRLSAIEHCIAKEDVRFYLKGMLMRLDGERLNLVSSDGARLGRASIDAKTDQTPQCIAPKKAVLNLIKLFKNGPIQFTLGPGQIRAKSELIELTSKTIDARYPEFGNIDRDPRPNCASLTAETLADTITAGKLNSDEKSLGVQLNIGPDKITAIGHNRHGEESNAETAEMDYTGEPVTLSFNAQYLLDALGKTNGQIEIQIPDNLSHILIVPRNRPAEWIVLPTRL